MSRKFFFSFVALVVLLSMVLASCGMPTPDVVTEEPPVETEEPATPEPTEETTPEPTEEPVALEQGNWDPENWAMMQEFITTYGPENPVAAFDWDNTCIFQDIGEATFRYTLFNLKFKMDPETFAAVIPEAAGATLDGTDVTVLSEDYGSVVIADLAADIESDYAYLYDTYEGLGCESD
ncbi:MAG: hypothetical protein RBT47_09495, partial [Anaerolineae bacterium]|nr:hypothetical protein [Anaerolineae bacterium]